MLCSLLHHHHHHWSSWKRFLPAGQVAPCTTNTTSQLLHARTCACSECVTVVSTLLWMKLDLPDKKKKGKSIIWGLFNLLHKCGGDCYIPPYSHTHTHSFPLPLCASSVVPECHGLSHEAGLSTGISTSRETSLNPSTESTFPALFLNVCEAVGS